MKTIEINNNKGELKFTVEQLRPDYWRVTVLLNNKKINTFKRATEEQAMMAVWEYGVHKNNNIQQG